MAIVRDDDARVVAHNLVIEVLPALDHRPDGSRQGPGGILDTLEREGYAAHEAALLQVAERLLLKDTDEVSPTARAGIQTVLLGMVAMRANTREYRARFAEPSQRYQAASSWICQNFGELIWWDCDRS
jgi:hypothetical protein